MPNNYLSRLIRMAVIRLGKAYKDSDDLRLSLDTISGGRVMFKAVREKWLGEKVEEMTK